jgi:hypothetical protein
VASIQQTTGNAERHAAATYRNVQRFSAAKFRFDLRELAELKVGRRNSCDDDMMLETMSESLDTKSDNGNKSSWFVSALEVPIVNHSTQD